MPSSHLQLLVVGCLTWDDCTHLAHLIVSFGSVSIGSVRLLNLASLCLLSMVGLWLVACGAKDFVAPRGLECVCLASRHPCWCWSCLLGGISLKKRTPAIFPQNAMHRNRRHASLMTKPIAKSKSLAPNALQFIVTSRDFLQDQHSNRPVYQKSINCSPSSRQRNPPTLSETTGQD